MIVDYDVLLCRRIELLPREALSIFVRRGCAVFQGIIFAYFSKTGYQKKAVFLYPGYQTLPRKKTFFLGRV